LVADSIANDASQTEAKVSPVFAIEPIAECWDEAQPMIRANHDETGMLGHDYFSPQRETFEKLEAAGILVNMTMRLLGKLVGYAVFIVSFGLSYPSLRWATSHVVYVTPEARGLGSVRFLRWQDQALREMGVKAVERQSSTRKDLARLYTGLGYAEVQSSWVRVF
jgi:hypothetical protein